MKQSLAGLLVLVAGCEGLTSAAEPTVSVLKRTNDGCFSLITSDSPVAPALGLSGECAYLSEPELLASVDLVEVVVDYGPNVTFAGDSHAPPPNLTIAVDGTATDVPITLSEEQRVGGRAFFVATFHTPTTVSNDMRITAGVNPGFQTEVPVIFAILPTPVTLSITDCPSGACVVTGGVGRVGIRVSVPGDVPQVVALSGAIDGVAQDPLPIVTTAPVENHTEGVAQVPVPVAPDGAAWTIVAQLGPTQSATVTATIHAPEIESALSCGSACAIARGQSVGLDIAAPDQIRPLQAVVNTQLDGVPQLVGVVVPIVEGADGFARGQLALTAPSAAGAWQIDVAVAGYTAPSIVTTVH